MRARKIASIEREFGFSYTENISINTSSTNPHFRDVRDMVENRNLSLSLRKSLNMS